MKTVDAGGGVVKREGEDVHARTFWGDAVYAGLIAGAVYIALQMLLVWLVKGDSPWGPPRMIAAIVLGEEVLPPPATFDPAVMIVAMLIHFGLSIVYGLNGAWMAHRYDLPGALAVGLACGLVIYTVNFHIIVPALFPWFVLARGPINILGHIVFGIVETGAYIGLRGRRRKR